MRPRERSPPRRRERTPPEVRLAREKEKELRELERATRTVFAQNLPIKADERDVFQFFSRAGKVTDIRMIMDRNTRKSKGLAYIEFSKAEEVFAALSLSGQLLMGQGVRVKASEAEKNLAWEAQQQAKQSQAAATAMLSTTAGGFMGLPGAPGMTVGPPPGPCKLQVSGLMPTILEPELKTAFEPFGALDYTQVVRDATGRPVGYGYVQFKSGDSAMAAVAAWNGKPMAGGVVSVQVAPIMPAEGGATNVMGELDEDEHNFKLNAQSRAALMARLANSAGLQPAQPLAGVMPAPGMVMPANAVLLPQPPASTVSSLEQGVLGPASPIPTPCLLLRNMFGPAQQTEPEWETEIAEDVKEECSRYGQVLHCGVDKNSKGFVYVRFGSVEAAVAAKTALHGRWYSGNQIVADYQFVQPYRDYWKV